MTGSNMDGLNVCHWNLLRYTKFYFELEFNKMEIKASAKNEKNGQNYQTSFKIDPEEA